MYLKKLLASGDKLLTAGFSLLYMASELLGFVLFTKIATINYGNSVAGQYSYLFYLIGIANVFILSLGLVTSYEYGKSQCQHDAAPFILQIKAIELSSICLASIFLLVIIKTNIDATLLNLDYVYALVAAQAVRSAVLLQTYKKIAAGDIKAEKKFLAINSVLNYLVLAAVCWIIKPGTLHFAIIYLATADHL